MQIATPAAVGAATTAPPPVASDRVLATLDYVIRAPRGTTRAATIEARALPAGAQQVAGGFADAVRAAQVLAGQAKLDGVHRIPVNPAHAVLQATDGAFWVAPLVGLHREAEGPIFIDGDFMDRAGLAVWARRAAADAAAPATLQAIVGTTMVLDVRRRPAAGVEPIAALLAAGA